MAYLHRQCSVEHARQKTLAVTEYPHPFVQTIAWQPDPDGLLMVLRLPVHICRGAHAENEKNSAAHEVICNSHNATRLMHKPVAL